MYTILVSGTFFSISTPSKNYQIQIISLTGKLLLLLVKVLSSNYG